MQLLSLDYALSLLKAKYPLKTVLSITPMVFNALPEPESDDTQYFGQISATIFTAATDFAINSFGVAPTLLKAGATNQNGNFIVAFKNVYAADPYYFCGWQIKLH
jgi:hypothetical protein